MKCSNFNNSNETQAYFTDEKSALTVIWDVSNPSQALEGVQSLAHEVLVLSIDVLSDDRLEDSVLVADISEFLSAITLSRLVSISIKS